MVGARVYYTMVQDICLRKAAEAAQFVHKDTDNFFVTV
jgi:hypothetical protein